jgi:hypothetical protein
MKAIVLFDPDGIEASLRRDLSAGLRQIAQAIESGQMDARLLNCRATAFASDWRDQRAHVLVTLDLAAEIRSETASCDPQIGSGDVPALGEGEVER